MANIETQDQQQLKNMFLKKLCTQSWFIILKIVDIIKDSH